jgi:hypothetical protein
VVRTQSESDARLVKTFSDYEEKTFGYTDMGG